MARLGSRARPAIVRVQTETHAQEIVAVCQAHGWQVIVGVEPDAPEDVSDVHKLLAPEQFIARQPPAVGRNAPCPCGSGRKYKKCCLTTAAGARSPHPEKGET
jgi:SWIM/SEC-C metal-binding protein